MSSVVGMVAMEVIAQPTQATPRIMEILEESQVAEEAEVPQKGKEIMQATEAQELEARCEYGPGNSEQRRTERPGCAEA